MSAETSIRINLNDKPNLMRLRVKDIEKYKEVIRTCIAVAEEAADSSISIPWYNLPNKINENFTFENLLPAIVRAFFDTEGINPEDFDFLGVDVHPMAMFHKNSFDIKGYPAWRKHFDIPNNVPLSEEAVVIALRKLYYYAKFININDYSEAFMNNRSILHKDDQIVALETLPYVPAIRYQKENLPDLTAGKFWDDIGALKGGTLKPEDVESGECIACQVGKLRKIKNYHVCTHCNIGFKVK